MSGVSGERKGQERTLGSKLGTAINSCSILRISVTSGPELAGIVAAFTPGLLGGLHPVNVSYCQARILVYSAHWKVCTTSLFCLIYIKGEVWGFLEKKIQ